jgi:hypothetical protein
MNTEVTCIRCGCTDSDPCPGGCSWVWVDRVTGEGVCTSCSPLASADDYPVEEMDAAEL